MEMRGLGYIGIGTRDVPACRSLMVDVLGVGESAGPPGSNGDTLYLKMDDRTWRIAVHPGEDEQCSYAGWELPSEEEFDDAVAHLQRSGVKVRPGTDALRAARGVQDVAQFDDPFGNHHELFYGPMIDEFVFDPPNGGSGFVTEASSRPCALRGAFVQRCHRLLRSRHGLSRHRQVLVGAPRRCLHALDAASSQPGVHRPPDSRRPGLNHS